MTLEEVGKVLAKIQLGDNREVTPGVIAEWDDSIGDLKFADAIQAVREHRRNSTDYLQPAHIRRLVAQRRALLPPADDSVPAHTHRWLPNGTCIYPGCIERPEVAS